MEEVSRGGIGLLDEKKLDMILAESRRFYPEKANESLVRRTISTYVCQTRGQMRAQGKKNVIFLDQFYQMGIKKTTLSLRWTGGCRTGAYCPLPRTVILLTSSALPLLLLFFRLSARSRLIAFDS